MGWNKLGASPPIASMTTATKGTGAPHLIAWCASMENLIMHSLCQATPACHMRPSCFVCMHPKRQAPRTNLVLVPHQHQLLAALDHGDEALWFTALAALIHHHKGKGHLHKGKTASGPDQLQIR